MPILSDIDPDGFFSNSTVSAYWLITRTGQMLGTSTAFTSTGRITMTVEGLIAAPNTGIDLIVSSTATNNKASFIYLTGSGVVSGGGNFGQGIDFAIAGSELHSFGTIMGNYAVRFQDGEAAKVFNEGLIVGVALPSGFSTGVQLLGGANAAISNGGLIEGSRAIDLSGALARIDNSGIIRGTDAGYYAVDIQSTTAEGQMLVMTNDGRIDSQGLAFRSTEARMKIVNTGVINGDVQLSNSADRFLGQQGRLDGVLVGGGGNDLIRSGSGDDDVRGGSGSDTLYGNDGEDVLAGGYGDFDDSLFGGKGDDTLRGGEGADRLDGGADDDLLIGDQGADLFVFRRNGGDDHIGDFTDGEDRLVLSVFGFKTFDQVADLAHDAAGGMFLDLSARNGGTVLIEGFSFAQFDASDVVI